MLSPISGGRLERAMAPHLAVKDANTLDVGSTGSKGAQRLWIRLLGSKALKTMRFLVSTVGGSQ